MGVFDSHEYTIDCPNKGCSGKVEGTIGTFRKSPTVRCPKCKSDFKVDAAELEKSLKSVDKSLKDFQNKLRKL